MLHRSALISLGIVLTALATAQVKPKFLYNGINRPFEVSVPGQARGAEVELAILQADTANVLQKSLIRPGTVDLAKTFPTLWSEKKPKLVYLQLMVNGKPTGPATVLQPLTNPPVATLDKDNKVKFSPDEDNIFAGYRAYVDQNVVMETTLGKIEFRMRPDKAPNTVWNMLELVRGGFYRDIIWHRVVAKRKDGTPFVIQAGDPTGTGSGSPGYSFILENSTLPHTFGVLSMARSTDPNTNGSQFFVALSRDGTKHLDGRYAAFAEAISGTETILETAKVKVGEADKPEKPPVIKRIILVDAAPYGTGPKPVTRPN